jgi:hypothetical protein
VVVTCILAGPLTGAAAPETPTTNLRDLRLQAERHTQGESGNFVVYGDGVGIWNDRVQFRVDEESLKRVLEALDAAHFQDMPAAFGSGKKWLVRRVSLKSGGKAKQVVQILEGEQSAELKALTDIIFDVLEPLAVNGKTAANLDDGLTRIASGELAPETFHLLIHFKPKSPTAARPGFLFQLQDGAATLQPYGNSGYGDGVTVPLAPERLKELTSILTSADVEKLPANLYAEEYSEVVVEVLNHRKSLLARQFAGLKPETHGEKQRRFDRLFESLRGVANAER